MGIGGCNHEGPRPLPPFSAHATMPCHYIHISNVCTHVHCTAPAPATRRPRTIKNNRDICSQDKPVSFPITSFCRASFVSYRSPAISPKRVTAPTVSRSFFVLIFFSLGSGATLLVHFTVLLTFLAHETDATPRFPVCCSLPTRCSPRAPAISPRLQRCRQRKEPTAVTNIERDWKTLDRTGPREHRRLANHGKLNRTSTRFTSGPDRPSLVLFSPEP